MYIHIFTEIVLILCFSVQSISWESTNFPLWSFIEVKFIMNIVVRSFWSLFSKTINDCHLFWDILFRLSISGRSSKSEVWSWRFFAFPHLSKGRVDLGIWKFDEILIGVCFLFVFFRWFWVSHFDDINNVTLNSNKVTGNL